MNQEINRIIADNKRKAWRNKVVAAGQHAEPTKFWGLLRGLADKRTHGPRNQPITFGSTTCSDPRVILEKFIRQYVPLPCSDPHTRKTLRNICCNHKIDHSYSPFIVAQTEEAIKKASSSTATGPDGLTSVHLKHLGPAGLAFLMAIFNLSVKEATVPAIWKSALVLPILKPSKPPGVGSSYRPISLVSLVIKILERLLLPTITASLKTSPM
jgi:hypothetical protein